MAQAPQGAGGAPRQNKTVKEFKGMNTQNRRNAIPEGSFAWLENIQPIGPGHLHSIPGRSTSVVRIPPLIPPVLCTDATERGQQHITIEDRFDQENSFPPFGSLHTSWGYINSAEDVWTLIGNAQGSGGNMAYNSTDCQVNHWQSPLIVTHPALIDPDGAPALNTIVGTSDEPIYGYRSADVQFECYYPNSLTHVSYHLPAGFLAQTNSGENEFAKKGTSIYFQCHDTTFPNFFKNIIEFSAASGTVLNTFSFGEQFDLSMFAVTTSFIYALGNPTASPNDKQIQKRNRSDGTLVTTFMLDNISPVLIGVANDNLIYVLSSGNPTVLYYIKNFTDLVYVGNTAAQSFFLFGNGTATFVGGAVYFGLNGISDAGTDIFKITINCPDGSPPTAIIASANRGAATVVAGATIIASWANVLEPTAADGIQLRPAPTGGDLGFVGAPVASQLTDGLGTSSIVFTIPGGTTPGTYVFMYAANNSIYVATSPTFTVT